jgi:hypothetical protein
LSASDELLTLAELAIGLAGFSGVVVAFTYRGELEAIDRVRFIMLLSIAVSTAVLAFVPFAFAQAASTEAAVWQRSSGVFLVWGIVLGGLIGPRLRRTALESGAAIPVPFLFTVWALTILNLLLQLANTIGSPFTPGPLPYVAGLVIWIVFSAFFFGFLVLFRPRGPAA